MTQRCSLLARAAGDRPLGTARTGDHLFVELPPPWPSDIATSASLVALLGGAPEAVVPGHVVALMPEPGVSVPGRVRVLAHRDPGADGSLRAAFVRHEAVLDPGDVAGWVREVFAADVSAPVPGAVDGPARDLFVCTHGTRDTCCGTYGVRAHARLRDLAPAGVRVWRTSHATGHRYAPTVMDFPAGRAWGQLDDAQLPLLARGPADRAELALLLPAYRGRMLLPPPVQVLEVELLRRHGRAWDAARIAVPSPATHPEADGPVQVALRYRLPGERERVARATVAPGPEVLVGGCGIERHRERRLELVSLDA